MSAGGSISEAEVGSPTDDTLKRWEGSSLWHDWETAALYQAFVDEFPVYEWLNRRLVSLGRLGGARSILDLACGTGATARGCLPEMRRDAELVGVDSSAAMVELARAEVADRRCRFVVGKAQDLRFLPAGRFDRAICNAALWQLADLDRVLAGVSRVLAPGAELVFSIPAEQLDPGRSERHPLQVALHRYLDRVDGQAGGAGSETGSASWLESLLGASGFEVDVRVDDTYRCPQRELVDLMSIPVMTASVRPGVSLSAGRWALSRAAESIDLDQTVGVVWSFVRVIHTGDSRGNPSDAG